MFDIVIIGAGVAGMTAALYARRSGKSVLVVEKETIGGQIASSPLVENFPTQNSISGMELADKLFEQCQALDVEFEFDEVLKINDGKIKNVLTKSNQFDCKAIILATGSKHRKLGLENEDFLIGKGVGYCVVCDGEFYAGKNAGVVGGGNSALTNALHLSNICPKVTIFQALNNLTAEESLQNKVLNNPKIEIIYNAKVLKLIGSDQLSAVEYIQNNTVKHTISLDCLFISIGATSQNHNFTSILQKENGYFDSCEDCKTNIAGIFVAGDCRNKNIRQLTTAVADGSTAAIMACDFLNNYYKPIVIKKFL